MQRLSRTLIQLNLATRGQHEHADASWLGLRRPTVDKHDYISQLVRVYGFEAPLEAALRYTPGVNNLVALRVRARSGLIVQDLMRLGLGAGRIAGLPQRFMTFSSAAEALGWLYVAERSTLIHGAIRRYLVMRLPELACATSYLSACDELAAERWSDFGAAVDSVATTPHARQQLLRAAHQGFAAQCRWLGTSDAVLAAGA